MAISPTLATERRYRVHRIINNAKFSDRGKKQALWNYLLTCEIMDGSQFLVTPERNLYIVSGTTNEIIPLPDSGRGGDRWFGYFTTMYGLSRREDHATWIYDVLRAYVLDQGARVELRRFSVYDQATKTAYLSAYNGKMYKIEGEDTITLINNGEDGIFFADDDPGSPCENPDIGNHGELIERLTTLNFAPAGLSGISPEQQKMALAIWIFALAFPDIMPTKPIILLEGTKGSGKSAAMMLLQLALMGQKRAMMIQRDREGDFGIMLLRSPIALFDNTDTYIEWVPDAVCSYVTSGTWVKRALYTNDQEYVLHPHAMIAVASKNPASFRRDDTADRCLVLRLERRKTFTAFSKLERQILADRPRLFGEYLWLIGRMVTELRAEQEDHEETHRMADFASIGRGVGHILGWSDEAFDELMDALQAERDAFISEEDPLTELLEKWVDYKSRFAPANRGRVVSLFDLHAELTSIAQANNITFKESTRTLMQKLRSTHVERDFRIELSTDARSQRSYQIWRSSDPRLGVVP